MNNAAILAVSIQHQGLRAVAAFAGSVVAIVIILLVLLYTEHRSK